MSDKTILQQMIERAEERRADAAFLRSMKIEPIEDDGTETQERDDQQPKTEPHAEVVAGLKRWSDLHQPNPEAN